MSIVSDFLRFDSASRVDLLKQLLGHCTHQEQLAVKEVLSTYLCRDFLTLLPPELVFKILLHLDYSEVLEHCCMVSRSWHAVINSCEQYWKHQCTHSGVFQDLDLLQNEMLKFGSFRALFSALLKFKARLKPELLTFTENKLNTNQCSPLSNGYYYSCPTSRNASISVSLITSKQVSSCTVENIFPRGYPSLVWSSLSDNGVLLYINNGKWLRFYFPSDNSLLPSVCTWEEDRVRSFIYHIAGSCPNCCLVVVMGKRRNLESLWELETLQFRKGIKNVITITTRFTFFPSDLDSTATLEASESLDPFRVHRVCVVPLCQSSSNSNSCINEHDNTEHRLLIQFGYAIVVFELSTSNSQCSVSTPLKVWCPNHHSQDFLFPSVTMCLLSKDLTIIALCKSNNTKKVHLWNTENGKEYRVVIPNQSEKVQSSKCLAVGHLFTVVAKYCGGRLPTIYIMSTESGGVFCECDLNAVRLPLISMITSCYLQETNFVEHKKLLNLLELGPCQILWLNTLKHSGPQDLCIVSCLSTCTYDSGTVKIAF